jgi:hypothetical protein
VNLCAFFNNYPSLVIIPAYIYFLALSQAPPVFDADTAIWTPLTIAPGKNPIKCFRPKEETNKNGVTVT